MHRQGGPSGPLIVSATDLVGFLECGHLTQLDRAVAAGHLTKPTRKDDPEVELLRHRGEEHERRYLKTLADKSRRITNLDVPEGEWTEVLRVPRMTLDLSWGEVIATQRPLSDAGGMAWLGIGLALRR